MSIDSLLKQADYDAKAKLGKEELQAELVALKDKSEELSTELNQLTIIRKSDIDKAFVGDFSRILKHKGFNENIEDKKYIYSYKDVLEIELHISDGLRFISVIQNGNIKKKKQFDYLLQYKSDKESCIKMQSNNQDTTITEIETIQKELVFLDYAIENVKIIPYKIKLESDSQGYFQCENAEAVIDKITE